MNLSLVPAICAAIIASSALSAPVFAQEKTAKACADEWKVNKAANQDKGITEKAYVAKCRGEAKAAAPAAADSKQTKKEAAAAAKEKAAAEKAAAAKEKADAKAKAAADKAAAAKEKAAAKGGSKDKEKSAAAPAGQKTAKACEDEWRANKAANQAKGVTEKAYVADCRGGAAAAAKPAAVPAAKKETPAAREKEAAAPAKEKPMAAPATGKPAGANQYVMESQAKARCPSDTVVWANLDSKIYHFAGHDDYGHTKIGAYMCEKDALAQEIRAAKNEKRPGT